MDLKARQRDDVEWIQLAQDGVVPTAVDSCQYGNEPSRSIQGEEFNWQAQWVHPGITGWKAGVRFLEGQENCVYSMVPTPALGPTQPPIQCMPRVIFQGVKRPHHEANHSPPSSAEVQNGGATLLLPHKSSWRGAYFIKYWHNLTSRD
jgi:hypothetical protein